MLAQAAVARELTKLHEQFVRGTLCSIADHFTAEAPRGEIVLLIDRAGDESADRSTLTVSLRVGELEAEGISRKDALKRAAKELGITRSEAYRRIVEEKE